MSAFGKIDTSRSLHSLCNFFFWWNGLVLHGCCACKTASSNWSEEGVYSFNSCCGSFVRYNPCAIFHVVVRSFVTFPVPSFLLVEWAGLTCLLRLQNCLFQLKRRRCLQFELMFRNRIRLGSSLRLLDSVMTDVNHCLAAVEIVQNTRNDAILMRCRGFDVFFYLPAKKRFSARLVEVWKVEWIGGEM